VARAAEAAITTAAKLIGKVRFSIAVLLWWACALLNRVAGLGCIPGATTEAL
jgi:hypothetical protein